MSKIKKAACLLLAAAMVWSGFGITSVSAYFGDDCPHPESVVIQGQYLYTTTVETGFVSAEGYYFICTEKRAIYCLDMMCLVCGRKSGEKQGYRIVSHSHPHCTNVDVMR